ncbi:MAG: prepilin-type N-terminal cleavage/methylation domain-containing protein [Phycisphaerales bacterium]|nr:prepilin-type N-terminal cleavage/methylation domain-containing protein [Phycisphaerales bacterium]
MNHPSHDPAPGPSRAQGRGRRGFSLVEMLIALTISATLLTAALVALDASFKGYERTSDSASTQVVTRIAMDRILGLIRTGTDFGPLPDNILDNQRNPIRADYFEYVSGRDAAGNPSEITRVEHRWPGRAALRRSWPAAGSPPPLGFQPSGAGALWLVRINVASGTTQESMLLEEVRRAEFELAFEIGPKLTKATVDITVEPNVPSEMTISTGAVPQTVRLVSSAAPRRLRVE